MTELKENQDFDPAENPKEAEENHFEAEEILLGSSGIGGAEHRIFQDSDPAGIGTEHRIFEDSDPAWIGGAEHRIFQDSDPAGIGAEHRIFEDSDPAGIVAEHRIFQDSVIQEIVINYHCKLKTMDLMVDRIEFQYHFGLL